MTNLIYRGPLSIPDNGRVKRIMIEFRQGEFDNIIEDIRKDPILWADFSAYIHDLRSYDANAEIVAAEQSRLSCDNINKIILKIDNSVQYGSALFIYFIEHARRYRF